MIAFIYVLGGLVFILSIVLVIWYFKFVKPLKCFAEVLMGLDLNSDSVDFTKLDTLSLKSCRELKEIKSKIDELVDAFCDRIDRVNDAIDQGNRDGLTGLYNVRQLEARKHIYENDLSYVVIFIDVNNLKRMNDEFGHEAGDALIKNVARKLKFWDDYGDVYRVGGDEFMVVLTQVSPQLVQHLIKSWYPKVGVLNREGDTFKCVLSYGVANGCRGDKFDRVQAVADNRMYKMKVRLKKEFGESAR